MDEAQADEEVKEKRRFGKRYDRDTHGPESGCGAEQHFSRVGTEQRLCQHDRQRQRKQNLKTGRRWSGCRKN